MKLRRVKRDNLKELLANAFCHIPIAFLIFIYSTPQNIYKITESFQYLLSN